MFIPGFTAGASLAQGAIVPTVAATPATIVQDNCTDGNSRGIEGLCFGCCNNDWGPLEDGSGQSIPCNQLGGTRWICNGRQYYATGCDWV
jgi:hypothetical protein